MNSHSELRVLVLQWIGKAESDFRNAQYVLTMVDSCPFDTVAYHAHQCAEKYIKGLLVFCGIDVPRTHDLVVLMNLAKGHLPPELSMELVQPLNRYSIESRYPGDWEPIEEEEARLAFAAASAVRHVIRGELAEVLAVRAGDRSE